MAGTWINDDGSVTTNAAPVPHSIDTQLIKDREEFSKLDAEVRAALLTAVRIIRND